MVKEEIRKYEAKPALSFTVKWTQNQMERAKESNDKFYEILKK